jgi:twitching motility protein PilT
MMQTGQDKYGMQTFNQSLATLYHKRQITLETAMGRSSNTDELKDLIERGAGINTPQQPGMPPRPGTSQNHPSPYSQGRPIGTRPPVR